jgi:D-aspartate ligase
LTPAPAVILGGSPTALAAVRSLGEAGVAVHVLGDTRADLVRHSRFCASFVHLGSGDEVGERWLAWLLNAQLNAVVIPAGDLGLEFVADHRTELASAGYSPVEANDEVVLAMLDKSRTYAAAAAAGVPAPRTRVLGSPNDISEAGEHIGFPCALKPVHSHRFAQHFSRSGKSWVVHDATELRRRVRETDARGLQMLATEIVPGTDDAHSSYYGYILDDGTSLVEVTKRKLRQFPCGFGTGTYHVTSWDPETAQLGLHFFREVGLRGLACVEFKRDSRDGRLKLIEVNHRLTLATELLRRAGVDLPLVLYRRALGDEPPPTRRFDEEVHLWFPGQDIRAFLAYRAAGELSLGGWLRSLAHRQCFPVLKASDPLPAVAGSASFGRRALRRALRR